MRKWYNVSGEQGDIVLSSRIRLARNLKEYPFPNRLNRQQMLEVNTKIREVTEKSGQKFMYLEMEQLPKEHAISLAERHLISPDFAENPEGRVLLITEDEEIALMLCEEDHIRLQVMGSGLCLEEAYKKADKLDNYLNSNLNYAFDSRLGYLTQCPTNLGTGMRASVMLHLPALSSCGQLSRLANTISKLGLTIRGVFGEGSNSMGDIYQLSNQVSLGISEEVAIKNLTSITLQIIAQERAAAGEMIKNPEVQDKIFRAYGVLKNARLLSTDEFMSLMSIVRLGAVNNILDINIEKISELIVNMQAATLSVMKGESLPPEKRDMFRAEVVRETI
ncbi:MAG: protein arginine kinase [Clostridia bacterium]|nr:protein arginine kinase [Clostridia bacterium]